MAFQFKNTETNQIYYINEVDEICAKFWGKEVHPKEYAYPGEGGRWSHAPNWFDMLGHAIENLQYFTMRDSENRIIYKRSNKAFDAEFDMAEVASLLLNDNTRYCSSAESMLDLCASLRPYIELCFHLKSLNIVGIGRGW